MRGIKASQYFQGKQERNVKRRHEETDLKAVCVKYARLRGAVAVLPNPARQVKDGKCYVSPYWQKGTADLILCWRGAFIAVELKSPTGRQSAAQKYFEQWVNDSGGKYYLVNNFEQFEAIFNGK